MSAPVPKSIIEAVREAIVDGLRATHGSKDGAAYVLDIGRSTLYRRLRQLDIRPEEYSNWGDRAA
jgi:transcriptional regulator of acetoin/glycerol metabolism